MHGICCHDRVFLIRPTPTHDNTLLIILRISIFWFADPTVLYIHDSTDDAGLRALSTKKTT